MLRKSRRCVAALLVVAGVLAPASASQAEDTAPEAALKAAFVFNFTKFVDWPAAESLDRFHLCTTGGGLAVDALDAFEGKQAFGKPIRVVRGAQGGALRNCQLLYVGEAAPAGHAELLSEVRGSSTLTVGDSTGFLDAGGVIALVREGGRLRFEINQGLAQAKGLKVGAQLLRLARNVRS